jgi:metallopeptidase MepB
VPLFRELIIRRDEYARLLGYPDYATFQIEGKMMKTPEKVLDFLGDLRMQLAPRGAKEIDHLKDLKSRNLKSRGLDATNDGYFYLWDYEFYNRLMIEEEYSVDQQKIAEHFPLQSTVDAMLRIFQELFGLVFVEITGKERDKISETGNGNDTVWHKGVKLFSVWDDEGEGSAFSGYLYLDLHPRLGKYGHQAHFCLQPGFLHPNGTRHYPAAALVCNFSKPTATKPSLLKHDEVCTLFHELGHGIHNLVSRTIYSHFHGTSVDRDFVEAPSQMLENWVWIASQLKLLSNHYKTGEKLPDEVIDKLLKTRYVNHALCKLRQVHISMFDMAIHTPQSHKAAENMKISELYNDMRAQFGLNGPEVLGKPK